jgi:hypothetical protein
MKSDFGLSPYEILATDAMLAGLIFCDQAYLSLKWIDGTPTGLAASSSLELQLQVGSAGDFLVLGQNLVAKQSSSLVASPELLVNLVSGGSDRQILNQPTHVGNIFGNYNGTKVPAAAPFPKLLQANSILSVTLTNLTATKFDYIYMTFTGFRIYYQGGTRQQVFHLL